jgi:uncharacterized membrane protein YebE (DUF533 family)
VNDDWFDSEVYVDARSAAVFARGMRAVARADGLIHQRELELIASFEAAIPADADATVILPTEALRVAYVRSLLMVALADGAVGERELEQIRELAAEQQCADLVERELLSVKRRFLQAFAGVNVFRDAVVRVAKDLGLPESEVDALSQEA